jgi:predicted O-methyltransferase YrrM
MDRLSYFKHKDGNRFWWFAINDYLPLIYSSLSDEEFKLLIDWYDETEEKQLIGECNVPLISTLVGFVSGNSLDRIIQCGHYAGYSTLLLGWALRKMGKKKALFSIDINPDVTEFTQKRIDKAGLSDVVSLCVGDSADKDAAFQGIGYFNGKRPKAVFIDSSHQYEHTLRELELWFDLLVTGGFLFLHDVSDYAKTFDSTGNGGVQKAIDEWVQALNDRKKGYIHSIFSHFRKEKSPFGLKEKDLPLQIALLNRIAPDSLSAENPYQDGCGLGILQK